MLISIIIANLVVSLLSLLGGISFVWRKISDKKVIPYVVSFAAGVILTTAFVDIFPESAAQAKEMGAQTNIFAAAFIGLLFSFFIERFALYFHHHEHTHGIHPEVFLITLGDGMHNMIDGVTIAAAFITSPVLGLVTSIAIAAHEIPHEIADFGILIHSGLERKGALMINFLSAVLAILGGVGGYYFLNHFRGAIPWLLAFSAGIFIYIASSDLIPDLHRNYKEQRKWDQVIPFILGIILMYVLITVLHEK